MVEFFNGVSPLQGTAAVLLTLVFLGLVSGKWIVTVREVRELLRAKDQVIDIVKEDNARLSAAVESLAVTNDVQARHISALLEQSGAFTKSMDALRKAVTDAQAARPLPPT